MTGWKRGVLLGGSALGLLALPIRTDFAAARGGESVLTSNDACSQPSCKCGYSETGQCGTLNKMICY